MAIEHRFYLDTPASRHALRDTLAQAGIGLEAEPDWKNTSGAFSAATEVTILDDLSHRSAWPRNGVARGQELCPAAGTRVGAGSLA